MNLQLTRPLCFLDLETTGLNIGKDRIIEICILKFSPNGNREELLQRFNPEIPISQEAYAVHGISNDMLKNEPLFKDKAREIFNFIDNADFAGFNALKFDIPLLTEEFLRVEVDFDVRTHHIIDVQNIFHRMEPRNLVAAYRFYCNKNLENAHSAFADTEATAEVLFAQIERYKETEVEDKDGNCTVPITDKVADLANFSLFHPFVDLAGHLVYNDRGEEIFNFGKYKGQTVSSVFQKEPQYYDWMMKADFPLYTKKIITGIRLRSKF